MANPQKEKGYLELANEVTEALYQAPLSGTELRLVLYVIRKTWGWRKKSDKLSFNLIATETRLSRKVVIENMGKLVTKKLLVKSVGQINSYSFNKNYQEWLVTEKSLGSHPRVTSQLVTQTLPKLVTGKLPTKNTKNNNKLLNKEFINNGDESPRVEIVAIDDASAEARTTAEGEARKKAPNADINEVIEAWKEFYLPTLDGTADKNRKACWTLLLRHGKDDVIKVIKILPKVSTMRFAPRVTSFMDLRDKWNKIGLTVMSGRIEESTKEVVSV